MGKIARLPTETELKKKNRTPSKVSASDGLDVTDSWAGEKKARIQSPPTSENLGKNVRADKTSRDDADSSDNSADAIDDVHEEEEWLKQIEGFNWSADDLRMGEYEQWEYYRKTCNTLQGDQEYIQFWEKLSSETKYQTYLAHIDENFSEDRAHILIREAVEIFVSRHKTYYDYAKKKLDIAEKIGLIVPSSPDCTKALIADGPAGDTSPLCITALGLAGDTMKRAPRQEFTAEAVQPIAPGPEDLNLTWAEPTLGYPVCLADATAERGISRVVTGGFKECTRPGGLKPPAVCKARPSPPRRQGLACGSAQMSVPDDEAKPSAADGHLGAIFAGGLLRFGPDIVA
nr:unnamed protein product [Digitaria exilis]